MFSIHRLCWVFLLGALVPVTAWCDAPAVPPHIEFARRVDELLDQQMKGASVSPAPIADDSEFLRRLYLDLQGTIPRVGEVRAFLNDSNNNKRQQLIDELLASPRHATHLANTWRQFMLPGNVDLEDIQSVAGVQNWLRRSFAQNMRYDRIVSDFLVATGGGDSGPALYYTAQELKPEKLGASTARIFLGLHLECAQCHKHPFDKWSQEDFWGYAAFFAQLEQQGAMGPQMMVQLVDKNEGDVKLPDSETVVPPQYPDGKKPDAGQGGSRRVQLAIWMASRDNPYLARAVVNRVWAHLFGRGLVEPVDDISDQNPASHPELFRELTDYFVRTGFDLRELFRTLTNTNAYQRTSRTAADQTTPPELFASMSIKTLTAEQLYDCLDRALMQQPDSGPAFLPAARGLFDPRRLAFAAQMQMRGQNATEYEAGVLQALTLLNGNQTDAASNLEQSALLAGVDTALFNDEERVETLFLATLNRVPTDAERSKFTEYVQAGGPMKNSREALSDVLWALLNCAEFSLNH
jgi:hypothetical protein